MDSGHGMGDEAKVHDGSVGKLEGIQRHRSEPQERRNLQKPTAKSLLRLYVSTGMKR